MDEQSLHTDTVHDWITGYLTNSLTPEEMQSFQEWLNASEENRKYFSDEPEKLPNMVSINARLSNFAHGCMLPR